ncbi:MAG TPA: hypothetical protein VMT18_13270 [Planctomycetota bacterium]|nr:hypothetical protein [Planctomycetota bacterium]
MIRRRLLAFSTFLALVALPAAAQGVGTRIPEIKLEGYSQTGAKSFEDFYGRAVLFEFFAYW